LYVNVLHKTLVWLIVICDCYYYYWMLWLSLVSCTTNNHS